MLSTKFTNNDSDKSTLFRAIWFVRQQGATKLLDENSNMWYSQLKTISKTQEGNKLDVTKSEFEYELNNLRLAFNYFMGLMPEPRIDLEKRMVVRQSEIEERVEIVPFIQNTKSTFAFNDKRKEEVVLSFLKCNEGILNKRFDRDKYYKLESLVTIPSQVASHRGMA